MLISDCSIWVLPMVAMAATHSISHRVGAPPLARFCVWTRWLAVWLVGIRTEIRGTVPTGEVLVASKHQSFLDVILIFHAVPRAKFIMKNLQKGKMKKKKMKKLQKGMVRLVKGKVPGRQSAVAQTAPIPTSSGGGPSA